MGNPVEPQAALIEYEIRLHVVKNGGSVKVGVKSLNLESVCATATALLLLLMPRLEGWSIYGVDPNIPLAWSEPFAILKVVAPHIDELAKKAGVKRPTTIFQPKLVVPDDVVDFNKFSGGKRS